MTIIKLSKLTRLHRNSGEGRKNPEANSPPSTGAEGCCKRGGCRPKTLSKRRDCRQLPALPQCSPQAVHSTSTSKDRPRQRQCATYGWLLPAEGPSLPLRPTAHVQAKSRKVSFFNTSKAGSPESVNPHSYRQANLWSVRWGRPPKGLWWFYPLKEGGGCAEERWRGAGS